MKVMLVEIEPGFSMNVDTMASHAVSTLADAMTELASSTTDTFGDLGTLVIGQIEAKVAIVKTFFADKIYANRVETKELCVDDVCVTKAQFLQMVNAAGAAGATGGTPAGGGGGTSTGTTTDSGATSTPPADTTAPTISITGANPALISVGDSYADLGAAVTDDIDQNIGYKVSLDGGILMDPSQLSLDTSAAGQHTITYSATDNAGNAGTATRTVIVNDPTLTP
jgi:hypothetical protein